MDTWAILPVKSLHTSKRRLAHILTTEERADLIHHLLRRTLAILEQTTAVSQTVVVSSDAHVLNLAWQYRAWALVEEAPHDLNTAVAQAVAWAVEQGATGTLILPVDLPLLHIDDVERMVANRHGSLARTARMAICTDKVGQGTNALFLSPPIDFTFHYGSGSFQKHITEAAQHNMQVQIIDTPNMHFDLDTELDWQTYQSLNN